MVDVSAKANSLRTATAHASVRMSKEAFQKIKHNRMHKGDVLAVAKIAGIQAAKKTSELIPLCHPIALTHVDIAFVLNQKKCVIEIETSCTTTDKTGVEMEALTAAAVCAMTIYDMGKSVDRAMEISAIYLLEKTGGKSGAFRRKS